MIDKSNEGIDQANPSPNGVGGDGQPSMESLLAVQSRMKTPAIPDKMLEGDTKPEKFIPRANLTEQLAGSMLRQQMDANILRDGDANMDHVTWLKTLTTMGLDGWSTHNVVSLFQANAARQERRGLLGIFGQRGKKRDMNGQENASADAL